MVKKILSLFGREFANLHETAFLLGAASFASQLLALLRDRLLAARFGAGETLDIYYAAFRIPDLVYVSIASFVSVTVLIPLLVKKLSGEERAPGRHLLSSVLTAYSVVMLAVSLIAFILMPRLAPLVSPGFNPVALSQLVFLSRIMLLSPLLLGLSNILGAATQSLRKFFVYAASPLLYNGGIILGAWLLYPWFGLPGLAWGVVLGALLHAAIQWPVLARAALAPRLTLRINWSELRQIITISLPRTLALGVDQIAVLALTALASLVGAGSIAVFNFALNLQSVPLAVIGASYTVAAFPTLVSLNHAGNRDKFLAHMTGALRHILFWAIPATTLFIVLRAQLVRVILGAGRFNWEDTRLVAAALALLVFSLAAQSLALLFARSYYAAGNTRRPLYLNLTSSGLTVALGALFLWSARHGGAWVHVLERVLRVEGLPGTMFLVLPLAYSIGELVSVILYWNFFQRDVGRFPPLVDRSLGRSLVASLAAGTSAYLMLNWLDNYLDLDTFTGIFTQGLAAGVVGLAVLIALLKWFGSEELGEITKALRKKIWRTQLVAPEPESLEKP